MRRTQSFTMSFYDQPAMTTEYGAILTVGMKVHGDRVAIVIPIGTDAEPTNVDTLCNDLVEQFNSECMDTLTPCLSEDTQVCFLNAEHMEKNVLPSRMDLGGAEAIMGEAEGNAASCGTTGLCIFYGNPDDVPAPGRLRIGKMFIPGVPAGLITGDRVAGSLQAAYQAFADLLLEGFECGLSQSTKYYRVLAYPRPQPVRGAGDSLKRCEQALARGYVATQRRRMIPRS